MLAPVTHILPLTTIRRERVLPVTGKVLVRKGQKVNTTDTIAEATLAPVHMLLELARGLGLTAEAADKHIQVEPGTKVSQGDILAGPVGFTRRVVRAPRDARVLLAGSGQLLLEVQEKPFELKAGLPGMVRELIVDRGAIVETTGALIQGVWGNGQIDAGMLRVLASQPDHLLTPDQVDVSLRGTVILAGYASDPAVLQTAAELPAKGVLLAGMSPDLISVAQELPMPVVVLEGFGQRALNEVAYRLLSTSEQRDVAVNAEPWDHFAGTRPEVVIPLPTSGAPAGPQEADTFTEGQQVRIIRAPYAGQVGTLEAHKGVAALPNGLRVPAAEIRLESGTSALVPLANLEVLE